MKKWYLLAALLLAAMIGRSAAQSVNTSFDKGANFPNYKTFKWGNIPSAQQLDELTDAQLIGTLEVEFAKKGLTKAKTDKADLLIGFRIVHAGEKESNHYDIGASYSAGDAAGAMVATVHSGLLALYIYDAASRNLIWRATVSDAFDPNAKPDKKQRHMDKAVEKLLKDYPPQKK